MGFLQWSLRASEGTAVDLMVNISKKKHKQTKKKSLKKREKKRPGGGKQLPQTLLLPSPRSNVVYYEIITDVITTFFNSHMIKVYTYIWIYIFVCLCRYLDDYILSYRKLWCFPQCFENTCTHFNMTSSVWLRSESSGYRSKYVQKYMETF